MADEDFDEFCRRSYPSVERVAMFIIGNRSEAEEVAQEAFVRAYSHWSRVRVLASPESWVRRVAANLAISAARRARVRRAFRAEVRETVQPVEPPDGELLRALGSLSPAQRTVVVLRFAYDLSVEQVASELNKAPGTVRALTAQGLKRLRERLDVKEVSHDG